MYSLMYDYLKLSFNKLSNDFSCLVKKEEEKDKEEEGEDRELIITTICKQNSKL